MPLPGPSSSRLEEIGAHASKEYSLEKGLEKMKTEWADMEFNFTLYRDTVRKTHTTHTNTHTRTRTHTHTHTYTYTHTPLTHTHTHTHTHTQHTHTHTHTHTPHTHTHTHTTHTYCTTKHASPTLLPNPAGGLHSVSSGRHSDPPG